MLTPNVDVVCHERASQREDVGRHGRRAGIGSRLSPFQIQLITPNSSNQKTHLIPTIYSVFLKGLF